METNSRILDYIKSHPETWEEDINGKLIRTSHDGSRVCFKYSSGADFSDPIVCEARGIIIDLDEMDVVCRPFDKFFNVQEQYAAEIDWDTARVLEKIDVPARQVIIEAYLRAVDLVLDLAAFVLLHDIHQSKPPITI